MRKVIKAKPGTYKGVSYRSQLEISWAKLFDSNPVQWRYVDESTHDFELYGDDEETVMFIEVKPDVEEAVDTAMERFFDLIPCMDSDAPAVLLIGPPPSPYSAGAAVYCVPVMIPPDDGVSRMFIRGCILSHEIVKNGRLQFRTYDPVGKGYIVRLETINAVMTDVLCEMDRKLN